MVNIYLISIIFLEIAILLFNFFEFDKFVMLLYSGYVGSQQG